MVRLRSNRWYGAQGQRRGQERAIGDLRPGNSASRRWAARPYGQWAAIGPSGTRAIVSLCLLLVLVLVLMRTVAAPENLQRAFASLGVPLAEKPVPVSPAQLLAPAGNNWQSIDSPVANADEIDVKWTATCRDLVPRLLDSVSSERISLLAQRWFAEQWPIAEDPSPTRDDFHQLNDQTTQTLNEVKVRLEKRAQASQPKDSHTPDLSANQWQELVSKFESQWRLVIAEFGDQRSVPMRTNEVLPDKLSSRAELEGLPHEKLTDKWDATFQQTFSAYLDARLVRSFHDGQSWQASEFVAFWRMLQRAGNLHGAVASIQPPSVNASQLVAQTSDLRGAPVAFRGFLKRIERVERTFAQFGFDGGYWQLWLQGEDLANQPVAVYASEMALADLERSAPSSGLETLGLEITALVGKRMAYHSQAGNEIAPTLFAIRISRFGSQATTSKVPAATPPDARRSQSGVALACVAASLLAAAIVVPLACRKRRRRIGIGKASRDPFTFCGLCLAAILLGQQEVLAQPVAQSAGPSSTQVPWALGNEDQAAVELLDRKFSDAIGGNSLAQIRNYLAGGEADELPNAVLKILHGVSLVGWQTVDRLDPSTRFAKGTLGLAEYQGWVRLAVVERLTENQASWYCQSIDDRVYRLELELSDPASKSERGQHGAEPSPSVPSTPNSRLVVFCKSAPRAWLSSARLRHPVKVRGIAVRSVVQVDAALTEQSELPVCLIAERPAWLIPSGTEAHELAPALSRDHYRLGAAGWNLSWIDLIADKNQTPLSSDEKRAFYTMLNVSRKLSGVSGDVGEGALTPTASFQRQKESVAKSVRWRVRLVKATRVPVEGDDERRLLGSDHYFQFDGFVDLEGQRVKYLAQTIDGNAAENAVVFEGEFPIVLVGASLPMGFGAGASMRDVPPSWDIGKYAQAEGIFYRLWPYRSERLSTSTGEAMQIAPMVILTSLTPSNPPATKVVASAAWEGWVLCVAIAGCLAIIWIWSFSNVSPARGRNSSAPPG